MNNVSPLKPRPKKLQTPSNQANSRLLSRSPHLQAQQFNQISNELIMQTPEKNKNANRSPFANIQNSQSSNTIKSKYAQKKQNDVISRIFDGDDHSPMKVGMQSQHLSFLNQNDRSFINDRSINEGSNQTLINRLTELEMQLRKSAVQRAIVERELENTKIECISLKRSTIDQNDENQQLRDQLKDQGRVGQTKHMDEINKLHSLLKEKNNVILQWTNRYLSLEKKYEIDMRCLRDQFDRSYQGQSDKRVVGQAEDNSERHSYKHHLNTKMQEADDVIAQTKKSYEIRSIQQEKEMVMMCKQIEGLQMLLSQAREQSVAFEKDRNQWIEKYESLVQQKYKNLDENKEKLIELRTINQMLDVKCKELKEDKEKLNNQLGDLQSQFMQQKPNNVNLQVDRLEQALSMNEKLLKDKELKLNQLQKDYNAALIDNQPQLGFIRERSEHQEIKQMYEKQLKTIQTLEQKIHELEQKLSKQKKDKDDQLKLQLQQIDNQRSEFQSFRMRDDENQDQLQIEKQILDKDNSFLKTKLNESEFKQRQLENENEKLHQIRQEKQREIEIWTRKADDTQTEYQMRLEELTQQFQNFQHKQVNQDLDQDSQQLFEKIEYLEQQYTLAKQEMEVWKQRAQMNETGQNKSLDDRKILQLNKYYDEQLEEVRSEYENMLRKMKLSLIEREDEIVELKQNIDQLQSDNFDSKVNFDKQTDQILKLELALQQFSNNYENQGLPSREFSFQNNGEAQNDQYQEQEEEIYFDMDRRKQQTLQSEEESYEKNYQSH